MDASSSDSFKVFASAIHDRYEIGDQIGEGGMAFVFRAKDVRHNRFVALKVIREELGGGISSRRFLREIQIAAGLQHPHIVAVHDSGETAGRLWYTMPLVDGESLRERLARTPPLSLDATLRIAREVGDALHYAHSRSVLHRDVKPENILLSGEHAQVSDFGVAGMLTLSDAGARLTATGVTVGTPAYMSPEQVAGDSALDARSDLYSFACVIHEMVAARPPFTAATAREVMAHHALHPPPVLTALRSDVPKKVSAAVARALAKSPGDRYDTVAAFVEALCSPDPPRRRQLRGRIATMGAMLVILLAAGTWSAVWRAERESSNASTGPPLPTQRLAVFYFLPSGTDADAPWIADEITERLIDSLRARQIEVASASDVLPYRGTDVSIDSLARALRADVLVNGSVARVGNLFRVKVWGVPGSGGDVSSPDSFDVSAIDLAPFSQTLVASVIRMLRAEFSRESIEQSSRLWASRAKAGIKGAQAAMLRRDSVAAGRDFAMADSLLQLASRQSPGWAEPLTLRAQVAFRRARASPQDHRASQWIADGIRYATAALAIDPRDANALEWRGNLRYWAYLAAIPVSGLQPMQLVDSARKDLEAAVATNPQQAGAFSSLSHLYARNVGAAEANLAAERAFAANPYLPNADIVLQRIILSAVDMGNFTKAQRLCEVAKGRFPVHAVTVRCQLYLLTTPAVTADVDRAWQLADSTVMLMRPAGTEAVAYERVLNTLLVAAVIARAARAEPRLVDSAFRVVQRSERDSVTDPGRDLKVYSAFVYALLGDRLHMYRALREYVAADPVRKRALAEDPGWWFRDYAEDPEFRRAIR